MDTSGIVPADLQRARWLGGFDHVTELLYKQWYLHRIWPATRVILWISVVIWATNPFILPRVLDLGGPFPVKVKALAWGVGLPVVLAAALLGERHLRV